MRSTSFCCRFYFEFGVIVELPPFLLSVIFVDFLVFLSLRDLLGSEFGTLVGDTNE